MKIEVLGTPEPEAFGKACQRMAQYSSTSDWRLHCPDRSKGRGDPAGWLEYLMVQNREDNTTGIVIALIQREVGAEFEFHS
jgi:hypothetical protein